MTSGCGSAYLLARLLCTPADYYILNTQEADKTGHSSFTCFASCYNPIYLIEFSLRNSTRLTSYSPHNLSHLITRHRMSVPATQKAVIFGITDNSDQTVRIEFDYPVPTPGKNELLIQNTLCGVNNVDTYYRAGFYKYKASSPTVLGHEAVGIVSALGPGTKWCNFKVGDRVIWVHKGAYAQYSAVPVGNTLKIPKGILDHDAIAGFLNGMTALALVKEVYKVNKGEWVLLHAAESNIGLLMLQILKSLGAKIIGTVDTRTKMDLVKSLGVDVVINYTDHIKSGWPHRVKEITKGDGPSVVYDFVGKDTWKGSLDAVKGNGTILWCGTLSGPIPPMSQR